MPQPYEIIAGPIQAYIAPLATAFPATPAVAPGGTWILLGASGDDNITEDGLTIRHPQETSSFRPLGRTLPRKRFRNAEDIEVEFVIADLTAEVYNKALGAAATAAGDVTDVAAEAGVAGYRHFNLERGFDIDTIALMLRCGMSPYGDGFAMQWEFPAVQLAGDGPELVFVKDEPVGLRFIYQAIVDPNGGSIRCLMQDAAPGS